MTARFLALLPSLTDLNGDAQNALVLMRRAAWAGEAAETVAQAPGEPVPSWRPSAVVLGTAPDSALARLREGLLPLADAIRGWLADGVPLLAVGAGLELLGRRIATADGDLEGLGLLPVDAVALPSRAVGDLVVDTVEGRLVGFENHGRGLRRDAEVPPLGAVLSGIGDGDGADGVRHGGVLGTHLHGPVLAKNPALADAILSQVFGRPIAPDTAESRAADAAAAALRAGVAVARTR